ncbi:hypothetical protein O3G_MSEX010852 [Manduca sexta]|uniref:Epoxide hydrolase n=2 Tax=Manduca sexta TaxID=7130 RepID=A0A921ZI11_MANSE|nr:hypothetical protein O3G_MSEX010852 [Manduca sexta]KAG6458413.1 hypothetical protein O3G_MSEX010852 [Manduca sexta]
MAKTIIFVAALAGLVGFLWWSLFCDGPSTPPLLKAEWWGPPSLKAKQDTSIRAFKVKFDEQMVADLKQRLKSHRPFTPPLEGVGFEYGFNSAQLDSWIKYWAEEYPFAEREKFFNQFPQFKTNIQGLDIHFIRVKPKVPSGVQILPLLLMHGWPGSVREFYEAIPLLTKQTAGYDFAFEVVVPSLPGFGFSDAAVKPGMNMAYTADIFRTLMHRLGHKKYYIQGGDWGAGIASTMATLYPDDILGLHSNMLSTQHPCAMFRLFVGAWLPSLIVDSHLAERMYPLSSIFANLLEESGYFHLQSTKPDTVGVSLTDSPSGLLAYILEKFSTWTRLEHKLKVDGGLGFRFSREQLVDNLMVYWSTNSITTSMRFYAENVASSFRSLKLDSYKTAVPTWGLQAKSELMYQPPALLRMKFTNLLNTTVLEDGGHFLAFELPQVFVEDVFRAVKAFREWHKSNVKTEL